MGKTDRRWRGPLRLLAIGTAGVAALLGQNWTSLTCNSDDGNRHFCAVQNSEVRMTRQRSGSPCIEGRTWGATSQGIWVDRGCRADFSVRPRDYGNGSYARDRDRDRDDSNGAYRRDRDGRRQDREDRHEPRNRQDRHDHERDDR